MKTRTVTKVLLAGGVGDLQKYFLAREAMSFEDLGCALDESLANQFGRDANGNRNYWLQSTFPDYVIARGPDGDLYKIPYTVGANDDQITFGDPQEVEVAFVPVTEAVAFDGAAGGDEWSFPVQVIKAGWAGGTLGGKAIPHYYTQETVAQVAQKVNQAKFGRRHPANGSIGADDPDRIAGWFENGQLVKESAIATLKLLKSETDLQQKFTAAREAGKLGDLYKLSILGLIGFKPGTVDGQKCLVSGDVAKLYSVDLVAEAGAGGMFLAAASKDAMAEISQLQDKALKSSTSKVDNNGSPDGAGRNNGGAMKNRILKVLEALNKLGATSAKKLQEKFDTLDEKQHGEFLMEVSEALTEAVTTAGNTAAQAEEVKQAVQLVRESLEEAKKIQSKNVVDVKLAESKLSAPAQKLVRENLGDRVVTEKEVDEQIVRVREAFAAHAQTGRIVGSTVVGYENSEKVQMAMDQLFGVKESMGKGVKPFRGIKDAFTYITGSDRMDNGGFYRVAEHLKGATIMLANEAVAASDFPNVLLNSMTKKLLQDYAEIGMGGLDILFTSTNVVDYKTQDRVREGYFGDLSDVSEAASYTEISKPTDEKIQYSVSKKGNVLTISEEAIRNDDLGGIARFPQRLARAARRTLKQRITNLFINNGTYSPDSTAWFHANHSNLGTAALTVDSLIADEVALYLQQEKDSTKPLGLTLDWLMVPANLKAAAWQINNAQFYNPGPGVQVANPFYKRFGENNERIIVNELLTDTNDYYYGTDKVNAPSVEVGFLDGYQEPQILLANLPTQGTQFTNDQLQYKVKHVYGVAMIDYRGVGKHVVP